MVALGADLATTCTALMQSRCCAADCVPNGLPRMVMPSRTGRASTLKPCSTSSLRSRR
jgi:hypothetical protein